MSRAKRGRDTADGAGTGEPSGTRDDAQVLRHAAEDAFAGELAALTRADRGPRPAGWRLSPRAVEMYILGGEADGVAITEKYLGSPRLVQIAIATLATDRALLLLGEPGTAKSWLSEHLSAAISGDSRLLVQGTAGTGEEHLRYAWNYALLLAEGPSERALVRSPVLRAMESGRIVRVEEITRTPSEVQDALITILSEKVLTIPELGTQVHARRGFNVIATANTRDRGVNEMSAALERRFNMVVLPVPSELATEVAIVEKRVREIGGALALPAPPPAREAVARVVQVFQELRQGRTSDGRTRVRSPGGALSTADAIGVVGQAMALAGHFGDGVVRDRDLAASLLGSVLREPSEKGGAFVEYLENVLRKRGPEWDGLYHACKDLL
jgi:MoxR-like ATPase